MARGRKKGTTKTGGRVKGSVNKFTTIKESVFNTYMELQGTQEYNLSAFAKENLKDFYNIAAKLIPTEISGKVQHIFEVEITE